MPPISKRHRAAIIVLLFIFPLALTPGLHGQDDIAYWRHWTCYIMEHGLCNAYGSGTNYTPLYQYFMWLFGLLQDNCEAARHYIGYQRFFTLAFDFVGLWMVWKWLDKKTDYLVILLLSILNVSYSYNTIIWQQVDSIMPAFVFGALWMIYRGKPIWSGVMLVLALNMKLQAMPFIPLWGLLLLTHFVLHGKWLRLAGTVGAMLLAQALIVLPFAFGEGGLTKFWNTVVNITNTFEAVSMNAFNMWYWILPDLKFDVSDTSGTIAGLSYLHFGLLLFCAGALAAFIPLLVAIAKALRQKAAGRIVSLRREVIWLTAAQIIILFFFFNTRMHERYSHPAFIFLTAYAFHTRRFGLLALFSVAHLLNMERVMTWFELPKYSTLVFEPGFVAALFALVIAGIYFRLYQAMRRGELLESGVTFAAKAA